MEERQTTEFSIYLKNGQEVKVKWEQDWSKDLDHLELRGPMTDTGFFSHFIQKRLHPHQSASATANLTQEQAEAVATAVAEKCWKENKQKHGKQVSLI